MSQCQRFNPRLTVPRKSNWKERDRRGTRSSVIISYASWSWTLDLVFLFLFFSSPFTGSFYRNIGSTIRDIELLSLNLRGFIGGPPSRSLRGITCRKIDKVSRCRDKERFVARITFNPSSMLFPSVNPWFLPKSNLSSCEFFLVSLLVAKFIRNFPLVFSIRGMTYHVEVLSRINWKNVILCDF